MIKTSTQSHNVDAGIWLQFVADLGVQGRKEKVHLQGLIWLAVHQEFQMLTCHICE